MKNKILSLSAVIVLCLCFALSVSAADTHIFDQSGYITPDAFNALEQQALKIEETYGCEVVVAIIGDSGQTDTIGYTKDLYKTNIKGENGIALTYNFGAQLYSYHCEGITETLFPSEEQQNIFSKTFGNAETYYDAVYTYLLAVEDVLHASASDTTVTEQTSDSSSTETIGTTSPEKELPLVVDNADILNSEEEAEFTAKLEALGEKYDIEVALLTVDTFEGKDGMAYSTDFYERYGYGRGNDHDGVMLAFNTGKKDGERELTLIAHGAAEDSITDMEREVIFEMMIPQLSDGNYTEAFDIFLDEADSAIDESVPFYYIPLSIVIGFVLAFVIVKIQASSLKTVRKKADAADYVGNVTLTYQMDNFMYKDVKSTPKSNNNSSSGGTSKYTSSSGNTYGGGSRKF